uniref:Tyrosine-protein phosphatase domain-containing protein n=1 Tax=Strongyloides venezuelensis TaxID=75913 RepID=A0A0K0FFB1_STRVS
MKKFYYFLIPNPNDIFAIKDPCVIVESFNECPDILLLGHNITSSVNHNGKEINIIHITRQNEKTFELKFNVNNNQELGKYYSGEKITYSRRKYHRIETIESSSKLIQSKCDIKGFDLIKLEYQCADENDYQTIEQIYYFGISNTDFHLENEEVPYSNNETFVTPNCTISRFNFDYLDAIIYNNKKVKINYLDTRSETKGKFNKTSDHILLAYKIDKIILKCIYTTPEEIVTTSSTFISGTRIAIGRDKNGNEIYSIAVIYTNITKMVNVIATSNKAEIQQIRKMEEELKESKKSLFQKNGKQAWKRLCYSRNFYNYTCIGLNYYNSTYPYLLQFSKTMDGKESVEKYCTIINSKEYTSDKFKNRKVVKEEEGDEVVDVGTSNLFDGSLVKCYDAIEKKIHAHYVYEDSMKRKYTLSDKILGAIIAIIYEKRPELNDENFNKFIGLMIVVHMEIYHVRNWNKHEIPQAELQVLNLYKEISKAAENKNILVYTSQGTGSRVYMFTYFSCIYDAMENYYEVTNPMDIIKQIREERYGGNIETYDYAYIIKALITIFFNNKLLANKTNHRVEFIEKYNTYLYNFLARESKINRKIRELKSVFNSTRVTYKNDLNNMCECFVNAYKESVQRQNTAPVKEEIDDMIYRYKVLLVAVLVKPEEVLPKASKWYPYFPQSKDLLKTSNYTVSRINHSTLRFSIINDGQIMVSVPSNHKTIYKFYKRIIKLDVGNYIAIHCSARIGRTGNMTLIIYMIDTIISYINFDPIARLKCLRESRYRAVQTFNQFLFAILVVYEHYKNIIDDMDPGA